MKILRLFSAPFFCLTFLCFSVFAHKPRTGFFLPDSVSEMTIEYRTVKGLIVLPVTINDSVQVNLILDTGCRNLILFGKKFKTLFRLNSSKPVVFSGLGSGEPVEGKLSIGNKVSINEVLGQQIPVVIVPSNNLFGNYHNVHGVIGYEIFLKFEIELNASERTITFRPAATGGLPCGYTRVPLKIVDARPVMQSQIAFGKNGLRDFDLMIDTGSTLGLLLKTTDISEFDYHENEKVLGIGFNGPISGYQIISERLVFWGLEMEGVPTGVVSSQWHNNASIGMKVLRDYVLILNYSGAYAGFKRNDA